MLDLSGVLFYNESSGLWCEFVMRKEMTAMEWGTISAASITAMFFSLAVSIGLPIVLGIIVYMKTHARVSSCFIGAGVFVVFALILEQILHAIMSAVTGTLLQNNILLYGLYGGVAAALFEETGRFVAMNFCMKNNLNKGNALMYGIGHGGAEAILIVGLVYVNNIVTSIMINSGSMQLTMSQLTPEMQEATYQQLQALWQTEPYIFCMAGIERMSAVVLQICLSVLVYKCVKTGQMKYIAGAFILHFIVDFVTVVTAGLGMPIWAVEIEIIVIVAIIAWCVAKIYRNDKADA